MTELDERALQLELHSHCLACKQKESLIFRGQGSEADSGADTDWASPPLRLMHNSRLYFSQILSTGNGLS